MEDETKNDLRETDAEKEEGSYLERVMDEALEYALAKDDAYRECATKVFEQHKKIDSNNGSYYEHAIEEAIKKTLASGEKQD